MVGVLLGGVWHGVVIDLTAWGEKTPYCIADVYSLQRQVRIKYVYLGVTIGNAHYYGVE